MNELAYLPASLSDRTDAVPSAPIEGLRIAAVIPCFNEALAIA